MITSPTRECGKSTLLAVLGAVVRRPLPASNVSPSALFRIIERDAPTLLIDEADTFARDNDELRGILNAGHLRSSAYVLRNVGDDHEPRRFSTWAPKALAAIGRLAPTIEGRAVIVSLRRCSRGERRARLRLATLAREAVPQRARLARWAQDHVIGLRDGDPDVPEALGDRAADNWRPLLAIADACGAEWRARARAAACALAAQETTEERGVELLADVRAVFAQARADRLPTADLVAHLAAFDGRPWADCARGKPITSKQLAGLLRPFNIRSHQYRFGDATLWGYDRATFADAFARYLPADRPSNPQHPQPAVESRTNPAFLDPQPAPPVADAETPPRRQNDGGVADVAGRTGLEAEEVPELIVAVDPRNGRTIVRRPNG